MILSLDSVQSMYYLDLHTHRLPADSAVLAVVCSLVQAEGVTSSDAPFRSYGIHPGQIEGDGERQWAVLRQLAAQPDCVAIGEAGLDRLAARPMALQRALFERQADLAEALGKPLIIHCVKAWEELLASRKRIRARQPWIIHGFRGKAELAAQLLKQGFYLSFGWRFQQEAAKMAWQAQRLFVETDEAPVSIQSVYEQMAAALSIDQHALCGQIQRNSAFLHLKNTTFVANNPK